MPPSPREVAAARHSGRSLASPSPVTKAKPNAVGLLWRGGTAEQVSFRIHPEANAAKLVPTRSCFLQAAACPRRENRKQDVSCRPACTKKSRLPAALHAVSIAHRSVPFHPVPTAFTWHKWNNWHSIFPKTLKYPCIPYIPCAVCPYLTLS